MHCSSTDLANDRIAEPGADATVTHGDDIHESAPGEADPEPGPGLGSTPGEGPLPTYGADLSAHAAKAQFALAVHEKFAQADPNALFTRAEIAVILGCSESWLSKGSGPRTRLVGRLRRSTKQDIIEYIEALPDDYGTPNPFRFG